MKNIYLIATSTNTIFSRVLKKSCNEPYPHVSIIFPDEDPSVGYSFSRKKLKNPFIGGFMVESYNEWLKVFSNVECVVYSVNITECQYENLKKDISCFQKNKDIYHYNLLGVIGNAIDMSIEQENHYFCTQFISEILQKNNILDINKFPINTVPKDILNNPKLELIFEGTLFDYVNMFSTKDIVNS